MTRQALTDDGDGASIGQNRAEQHQQCRGLARAVRSEESNSFAWRNRDADTANGLHLFEGLTQFVRDQDVVCVFPHPKSLPYVRRRQRMNIAKTVAGKALLRVIDGQRGTTPLEDRLVNRSRCHAVARLQMHAR